MPREIDLREPMWIVVTPDNWEEQLARIEEQEGELVFLAMTIPDYEVMAYNMQELKRYINELKEVVVYYRTVTTANKPDENQLKKTTREPRTPLLTFSPLLYFSLLLCK